MSWAERVAGALPSVDASTDPVSVDVDAAGWVAAVATARDELGCTFFDWLSAVDEGEEGVRVVCHLAAHRPGHVDHLVVRALLGWDEPVVPSVGGLFAGAAWHERETHEMFGVVFTEGDEPMELAPLLLPVEFEGHPLRKDFVLAARVARPWPGASDPGQVRRRLSAPGVPADWAHD